MTELPHVRFVRDPDGDIAYTTFGEGPDLIAITSWYSPLVHLGIGGLIADFHWGLARFARVVAYDQRGTGASDDVRFDRVPDIEWWMNDALLVAKALDLKDAVVFSHSVGPAATAILLAATHPELVRGLVLLNPTARSLRAGDYPIGLSPEEHDRRAQVVVDQWDSPDNPFVRGSRRRDTDRKRRLMFALSMSLSPTSAKRFSEINRNVDVRSLLPQVSVPTLVMARSGASDDGGPASARYIAERIPHARYLEIAGGSAWYSEDAEPVLHEIETFVTGARPAPVTSRVLATVLFTDIVSSTETTVALGDRKWRDLIGAHDQVARREVERHHGRLIGTEGDSVLATFPGPGRAIECAHAIGRSVEDLGVSVRAGLHTGEIELRGDDIAGIAVNIAHRVMELAGPGEILVSRTVADLSLGSEIDFTDRGVCSLKGVPGDWQLYAVTS